MPDIPEDQIDELYEEMNPVDAQEQARLKILESSDAEIDTILAERMAHARAVLAAHGFKPADWARAVARRG